MTRAKIYINGCCVSYEKFGSGSKPLLMIPGAIGTGRTDFYHQIYGEDAFDLEMFTIICVELLGWGESRPPDRNYNRDVYKIDSQCCVELMQSLGYNRFSLLGWSEGARVALVLTTIYPQTIENLILMGIISFQSDIDTKNIVGTTKDVDKWNQITVDNYLRVYKNKEEIQQLWNKHMDFIEEFPKYFPNGCCDNKYVNITCPVLIFHGDKDPIISIEHPLFVSNKLNRAKIERFPDGSHNLHHKYRSQFKSIVQDFLLGNSD